MDKKIVEHCSRYTFVANPGFHIAFTQEEVDAFLGACTFFQHLCLRQLKELDAERGKS